jgi:transposase
MPGYTSFLRAIPKELAKTGVSRYTLWMEYRKANPQGLKVLSFLYPFRIWQGAQKTVMHLEHKAGEKLFVDFAGKKLYLTSPVTGEVTPVEFFVAILPCSQLCFALAVRSQQKADFIEALRQTFEYIGGVPQAIVPDNLKTAVTKADRYEPEINETMEEFASHYKTCFLPARAGNPKTKHWSNPPLTYSTAAFTLPFETASSILLLHSTRPS